MLLHPKTVQVLRSWDYPIPLNPLDSMLGLFESDMDDNYFIHYTHNSPNGYVIRELLQLHSCLLLDYDENSLCFLNIYTPLMTSISSVYFKPPVVK